MMKTTEDDDEDDFIRKYSLLRGDWILQNGCFFGKLPNGLDPPLPPFLDIFSKIYDQNTPF